MITYCILFIVVFGALSVVWSQETRYSFERAVAFSITVFASMIMGRKYDTEKLFKSIAAAFIVYVLVSVALVFLAPSIALENSWEHFGKWRGLSGQKNVFGVVVALTFVLLFMPRKYLPRPLSKSRIAYYGVFVVVAIAIIKTGSRSALVDVILFLMFFIPMSIHFGFSRFIILFMVIFIPIIFIVGREFVNFHGGMLVISSIEIDTSNRLLIWEYGFDVLRGRELFGFGLGFWTPDRMADFTNLHGWVLPNFHNGYIATLMELGVPGLAALLLLVFSLLVYFASNIRRLKKEKMSFMVGIVILFLGHNLYENNIMRSTDVALFLFLVICFHMEKKILEWRSEKSLQ